MERVDICIIGAGVCGLAIARELSGRADRDFRRILLLDSATGPGTGVSSRNSEVIHAGIYYPQNSLKAQLCLAGRDRLYEYCEARGVAHLRTGKLIVAQEDEERQLEQIEANARANGVAGLEWLSGEQVRRLEPAVRGRCALLSPDSGIVDSHGLMQALLSESVSAGVSFAANTRVHRIEVLPGGFKIFTKNVKYQNEELEFKADRVINAAGLGAQELARELYSDAGCFLPELALCKGDYF